MDKNNNETKLDGLIRDAIGGERKFDFVQWQSQHPQEVEAYRAMNAHGSKTKSRNRTFKISAIVTAAAAILIIVFYIGTVTNNTKPVKIGGSTVASSYTPLPAHLPTIGRLNVAYAEGGIEAIDKFGKGSVRKSGSRPGKLTARDLLIEFESKMKTEKGSDYEDQSYNSNSSSSYRA